MEKWRVGSLNVGTMTGRGREVVDMMVRRRIGILCVQETKWKGAKARGMGEGYRMVYMGTETKRNGVGIVLSPEAHGCLTEVRRVSDRVMRVNLELEDGAMYECVMCVYAPQCGTVARKS